jgi:hypothetical protein
VSEEKKTRSSGPASTNEQERHPPRRAETLVRHAMADSARDQAACVSAVIGEGAEAHRIVRVGDWTFTVLGEAGTEPEIPDTALASRLGLPLHKLRELSGRHEKAGNLAPRMVYPTVGETGGRPGMQRFYTEADALFLVTRSETPKAIALTKEMIGVYMLARRGLLAPVAPREADPAALAIVPRLVHKLEAMEASAAQQGARIAELEHVNQCITARLAAEPTGAGTIGARLARTSVLNPIVEIARIASERRAGSEFLRARGRLDADLRDHLGFSYLRKWSTLPENQRGEALSWLVNEKERALRDARSRAQSRQGSLRLGRSSEPPRPLN